MRVLFAHAVDPQSEYQNRFMPLWSGYLAAYAEKHLGRGRVEFRMAKGDIDSEIAEFCPDIVAISSVTRNFNHARAYARTAKDAGVPVIIGGIHISVAPDCFTKEFDVAVMGEGEQTFLELLRLYMDRGRLLPTDLRHINGVAYHGDSGVVRTPAREMLAPEEMVVPDRSLSGFFKHDRILTSRGCPYRCVFCAPARYWQNVRFVPSDLVIADIQQLVDNGARAIHINDDLFVANRKRLRQVSGEIIRQGIHKKVSFFCTARSNMVTPEVVELLKAMNVVSVALGLESGNQRVLNYLKGKVTVADNLNALTLLTAAGIHTTGSFVFGSPDETREEIQQTYDFIKRSPVQFFEARLLTPYPGTPVWEDANARGLVSDDMDWGLLDTTFSPQNPAVTVLSQTVSRRELTAWHKKFQRLRLRKIIWNLPSSPWLRDAPRIAWNMLKEKVRDVVAGISASQNNLATTKPMGA